MSAPKYVIVGGKSEPDWKHGWGIKNVTTGRLLGDPDAGEPAEWDTRAEARIALKQIRRAAHRGNGA